MLHGSLCKKVPFLFCPEPNAGHWQASVQPSFFLWPSAAPVPGNSAVPQLIKPPIFLSSQRCLFFLTLGRVPCFAFLSFPVFALGDWVTGRKGGRRAGSPICWGKRNQLAFYAFAGRKPPKKEGLSAPCLDCKLLLLFYPLVTHSGLCRTAATKEKFWGPQNYYPLNCLPLSCVYKQRLHAAIDRTLTLNSRLSCVCEMLKREGI